MRKTILGGVFLLVLAVGSTTFAGAAAPEKMLTATGSISKLQSVDHVLTVRAADKSETRFTWTADTKINGTLSQGAKVTVRFTTLPDGQNLAHQISVGH